MILARKYITNYCSGSHQRLSFYIPLVFLLWILPKIFTLKYINYFRCKTHQSFSFWIPPRISPLNSTKDFTSNPTKDEFHQRLSFLISFRITPNRDFRCETHQGCSHRTLPRILALNPTKDFRFAYHQRFSLWMSPNIFALNTTKYFRFQTY